MLAETLLARHGAKNAHATPVTDDRFVTGVTSTWRRRARGSEVMTAVVVLNPHRRGVILAVHAGLTAEEANELVRVYRALGYPDGAITITSQEQEAA